MADASDAAQANPAVDSTTIIADPAPAQPQDPAPVIPDPITAQPQDLAPVIPDPVPVQPQDPAPIVPDPVPAPPAAVQDIPASPDLDADIRAVLKNADHDDTSVDEVVNPAVAHETVRPTELDIEHPTLEKEINEDTYHTNVQTITDSETQPTRVIHTIAPIQERVVDERDTKAVEEQLAREAAQFHDERMVQETVHTHASAPTVVAEHHHYHVHERIQPVIQREVIQPTVVHTTVPVHEVHHRSAHFTPPTSLAPISMADFKQHGGHIKGRSPQHLAYDGKPQDKSVTDWLYDNPQ